MIYANNAGTSWPKPPGVAQAVREALDNGPRDSREIFQTARSTVCAYLGIQDPERFIFTPGCTSALAVAFEDLPWRAGDRVLTSSLEHHAMGRPIQKLATGRQVEHVAVPYRPEMPFDLDFVRDQLRGGRVRLVALSGASNVTGELLPVAETAQLAHDYDALCLVDAAQTVGVVPVDVIELGADLLVFAGHKGPLGPQGIGGLWAAAHVEFDSPQAACSLQSASQATPCAPAPGYCDVGSANIAACAGLNAGLRFRAEHDRGSEAGGARQLARRLALALGDRPRCTVYGGPENERTATLSLTLERLPVKSAEAYFAERHIVVRAAEHCAPWALDAIGAPGGTIRISFGPHNTADDVEAILEVIDAVA